MQIQKTKPGYKIVKSLFGKYEEIPEKWDFVKILDNSTLKGRIGWQGLTTAEYRQQGKFHLVTGTDFKNGKIDWKNCVYVDEERYVQDTNIQLKKGDVLVTKDGTIGKIAYVDIVPLPATLNSGIFVIRPVGHSYFPLFLFYILHSNFFMKFLNKLKAGSTINHLYQKDFENFQFPIPPYPEQQKIASIISNIDSLIQHIQKEIEHTQTLKKGLMSKLLTKGIGHTKFKKTKLGKIPEEWILVKLKEIANIRYGLSQPPELEENGIPMIRATDIKNGVIIEHKPIKIKLSSIPKSRIVFLKSGDIIVVRSGVFTGDVALITKEFDGSIAGYDLIVSPFTQIDPSFLCSYLLSPLAQNYFLSLKDRSAQSHLNAQQLSEISIYLPHKVEQQKIASILSNVDYQIKKQQEYKSKLEILKKGLMQKLLTGQIRVKV